MPRRAFIVAACASGAMLVPVAAPRATAQQAPAQLKLIVPFSAGSTPDVVARLVADGIEHLRPGRVVIVENKPGASGNLGTETVARAKPDGATIGISIGGPLAINTLLFARLRYDPSRELAPITQLVSLASVLAINTSLPAKSVGDLLAVMRAAPGKYTFGSIGTGSLSHLAMEAVAIKADAKIVHLPFQGSPQAVTALLRNDIQVAVLPAIAVVAQAQSDAIRMLAVSTARRSPFLPDLPTLCESGIDVEADAWSGLVAPAGTPRAVIEALYRDAGEVLKLPAVRAKLAAQMMQPVGSTPDQFGSVIAAEIDRWRPVIDAAHIRVD